VSDPIERIVNLVLYLAAARGAVKAQNVRAEVTGYPEGQDDDAFIRMFERDKDDLRRMGFAIESDEQGNYRIDTARSFASAVELTPAEAATVRVAGAAALSDAGFPFAAELRLALAKLSAETDSRQLPVFARLADEDPERQGETVAALTAAEAGGKRVSFGYTNSLGVSAPHEVEPYGLFLHDGRWYAVGRDTSLDEVRTYTVARMRDVSVDAARPRTRDFERPIDFDVAAYARLPFQYGAEDAQFAAVIEVNSGSAWRIKSLTAGQGDLVPATGGAVTWTVTARSHSRLLRFIIENGPGLRLVGPPEVLARMRADLERTVALHG
jgi:proteasome accessory factor B